MHHSTANQFLMRFPRRLRSGRGLIPAVVLLLLMAAPVVGQYGGDNPGEGTWPVISVSVAVVDGVVWVTGRDASTSGRIIWQYPLVGNRGGVALDSGPLTTYVVTGGRRFLIHNATGEAAEMRDGEVYQRYGPGGGQLYPPREAPPTPTPETDANQFAEPGVLGGEGATAERPQDLPPRVRLPANVRREVDALRRREQRLQDLIAAHEELAAALLRLEEAREWDANAADLRAEELAVTRARTRLAQQERTTMASLRTPATPGRDANDVGLPEVRETPELRQAQERVVSLTEDLNMAVIRYNRLQREEAPRARVNQVQDQIFTLQEQIQAARVQLQLETMLAALPEASAVDPNLRARIESTYTEILDLRDALGRLERIAERQRPQRNETRAYFVAYQQTVGQIMSLYNRLTEAENRFESLRRQAMRTNGPQGDGSTGRPQGRNTGRPSNGDTRRPRDANSGGPGGRTPG